MCGFAGYVGGKFEYGYKGAEMQLAQMADMIISRGPDSSGHWIDQKNSVALTHRRLAVLDLTNAGHQPFVSQSGRYVLVYNGEIYNHLQLRSELKVDYWCGNSDTETLLAYIDEFGLERAVQKINGMFAFALWDKKKQELSLVRDRIGEKPLYYGWQKDTFLFGSDLAALKVHANFISEIDRDSLSSYLRYNYVPTPASIFKNIYKLTPGTILKLKVGTTEFVPGVTPDPLQYWCLEDVILKGLSEPFNGGDKDAIALLNKTLMDAVKKQMISDVPIGVFLSGGIDSSTIAAMMQSQSHAPVNTFTIGFDNQVYNEAIQAKLIANHLGTQHHELYVSAKDTLNAIPDLQTIYSEPFADSSQIPTYLVSKLAKKHVTVSLSGDGGDELFGGYNRYQFADKYWPIISKLPVSFRNGLSSSINKILANSNNSRSGSVLSYFLSKSRLKFPIEKMEKVGLIINKRTLDEVYLALTSICQDPSEVLLSGLEKTKGKNNILDQSKFQSFGHNMMYRDTLSYLPDDILVKVDRAAMAVSLETRVPFLDHNIIDLAWSMGPGLKIRNGQGKWILRQVLDKYVPRELVERPKQGFSVPIDQWLRGPLKDWASDLIDETRLNREGFFNASEVSKKFGEHLSGDKNCQHHLWGLLMFQSWLENNKKT